MATKTSICNIALTNISAKNQISNIETDTSTEAKTCRVYYEDALKFTLADLDWGFATARIALSLLAETAPSDWDFTYVYPNNCIRARQLFTGVRRRGIEQIPFEVGLNSDGTIKVIYADQGNAVLLYTANITDPNLFPPAFVMLLSSYLSKLIAYPLSKKTSIKNDAEKAYKEMRAQASAIDASEDNSSPDMPESEFIRARD